MDVSAPRIGDLASRTEYRTPSQNDCGLVLTESAERHFSARPTRQPAVTSEPCSLTGGGTPDPFDVNPLRRPDIWGDFLSISTSIAGVAVGSSRSRRRE